MSRSLRMAAVAGALAVAGCYGVVPSSGGGDATFMPPRRVNPADVAVPAGYRIEAVAQGLTFPAGIAFDEAGALHVIETGYSYGEVWTTPRLLRIERDGRATIVAAGTDNGPWTGVAFHRGVFYVAEGGELHGGRILRVSRDGQVSVLVENLPSQGDHHTNGPAIGPDGWIYFGQGTVTNSGVVGPDNAKFGWLKRYPAVSDIPCRDIRLRGVNFTSENALAGSGRASTGAFAPYGTPTAPGQVIAGRVPCSGAILRVNPDTRALDLVAWGLRNPFGLAFAPNGRLFVTENGYDVRGSRPVFGAGDVLWAITPGGWHGWPDYFRGVPLDSGTRFAPVGGPTPPRLLAEDPGRPPLPAATLGVHSSSNGIDFSRSPRFGHVGQVFVAQFGDQTPDTGKVSGPVGFKVIRVDVETGVVEDFAVNKGAQNGPASKLGTGGLERPLGMRFSPDGSALYIADFGVMTIGPNGPEPRAGTGVIWRVTRGG